MTRLRTLAFAFVLVLLAAIPTSAQTVPGDVASIPILAAIPTVEIPTVDQTTPAAPDGIAWDYSDAELQARAIAAFLVCVDGQPTSNCTSVPVPVGPAGSTAVKTYTWKLPALLPGSHSVAVQACTLNLVDCSSGIGMSFVVKVALPNPTNLRLVKIGG